MSNVVGTTWEGTHAAVDPLHDSFVKGSSQRTAEPSQRLGSHPGGAADAYHGNTSSPDGFVADVGKIMTHGVGDG